MNKNHSPYIYIYIALAFMLLIASCDKPQSENKATSSSSVDTENTKPEPVVGGDDQQYSITPCFSGANPKASIHTFTFSRAFPRIERTANSCKQEVTEAHKPTDDDRTIAYSSSNDDIATVDNKGIVTFVTAGTVTIKAEKQKEGKHVLRSAQYTLYITVKPAGKAALIAEIKRATTAHGDEVDLNYIDTSAITHMNAMFSFSAFNGDISKWDVSKVTTMNLMFGGATAFNQDISAWNVSQVTNMSYMFYKATAFNQNLGSWGQKLHANITANNMAKAYKMFQNSGVAPVPTWCTKYCNP